MLVKNILSNIKYLPEKTKYLLVFGTIIALVVALPIFIWAITTQNFEIREKAQEITPSPTATASASPSSSPTASPTATPVGGKQVMTFRIKFTGIADGAAGGAKMVVRFLTGDGSINQITPPLALSHTGSGIYEATMVLNDNFLPHNRQDYAIIVKSEKHLARKFCQQSGQTLVCTTNGRISVPDPNNSGALVYDFTSLPLDPGDLYPQDGKADVDDFNKILGLMTKTCVSLSEQDKLTADLDYSGCVNVKDIFWMRKTLETRYDER